MTDRELLEAAAKAAGLTIHARNQAGRDACGAGDIGLWISNTSTCWNPLNDDADAFRLSVTLCLETVCDDDTTDHMPFAYARLMATGDWTTVPVVACPFEAMRRAIVECAAKLDAPAVRAA